VLRSSFLVSYAAEAAAATVAAADVGAAAAAKQVLGNQLAEYKRVFVPTAAFWGKGVIRRCVAPAATLSLPRARCCWVAHVRSSSAALLPCAHAPLPLSDALVLSTK
jgi:hypothetical protein